MAKQSKSKEVLESSEKVSVKIVRTKVELTSDLCITVSMKSDIVGLDPKIADALRTLSIIK